MIDFIKGKIAVIGNEYIVIENGGIGFRVNVPLSTLTTVGNVGDEVKIYTVMNVREDDISLFGFASQEEVNMFGMLITVSGVGPKMALSIISAIPPSKFGLAVISNDAKLLTVAPGVGNKVAQRIILELKDKISKQQKISADAGLGLDSDSFGGEDLFAGGAIGKAGEAESALVVLGFSKNDSHKAINAVYDESLSVEELIVKGLALLGK